MLKPILLPSFRAVAFCFCSLLLLVSAAHADQPAAVSPDTISPAQQEIINLSAAKWKWMADKDVARLAVLFHDQSKFVHMSGTWKKAEELEIIQSGSIWYKHAEIKDVAAEIVGDTAVVWTRLTLQAVVRGAEVATEFTVTEVFTKQGTDWKLLVLTFSSVRDTHAIKH
jgi:ketosteroid isomerase-like protein